MSILPAGVLSSLRAGLSAAFTTISVTHQQRSASAWVTVATLSCLRTDSTTRQEFDEHGHQALVTVVTLRPMADDTIEVGDRIIINSVNYWVTDIAGSTVRRVMAVNHEAIATTRSDRFRFQGT